MVNRPPNVHIGIYVLYVTKCDKTHIIRLKMIKIVFKM